LVFTEGTVRFHFHLSIICQCNYNIIGYWKIINKTACDSKNTAVDVGRNYTTFRISAPLKNG